MNSLQLGMHWFPERPGGLDRMYYTLFNALPDAGVNVHGLVAGNGQAERDTGGRIRSFAGKDESIARRLLASRRAIREEVRAFRPDNVAIHFALYAMPGMQYLADTPTVMHFHGPWASESGFENPTGLTHGIKAHLEKSVYKRSQRQIVLSRAFATVLEEQYGMARDKIEIVPGCIHTQSYETGLTQRQAREKLGLPTDRPIIVAVRRLVRRMGLEDLVDAVAQLREKWPDLLLVIAGKGPLSEELRARAEAKGIGAQLKLLGYVPDADLPLVYQSANFSIVPTVALEGFGLITIESLACGTPVMVTPVGGLPDAVSGLSPDLVLPATGSGAIATAIDDVMSGRLKLPDSEACRSYARTHFDVQVIAQRTREVYERAAA
ncbi:glycosyltransferase family 4 protein [Robbsia sp. KACC 23696]|uniref:glycosyltransferase family 4 protein n=1 Tax=Robbsia sp. KACC 23696 TaxID=3149231 RepID=UPI00325BAA03